MNESLATALLATAHTLVDHRLNVGSSGNVSVRDGADFLITPSGMAPAACTTADMVSMTMDGQPCGRRAPSSEWRIHRDIYRRFPAAAAIIHTHAPFATALACLRREIPPFHYMIARFGGDTVRCAAYATFGTEALSHTALAALEARSACLLANHGMIVYGHGLDHALALAEEFETLCEQYWRACQLGAPVLLTRAEMADAIERFRDYGSPQPDSYGG
ncbi:fuculose phosphate aldolase [Betaproteobacteria bacterium]|nr:fuculose phosphate aldolase [Betaproteobacteria bacterium]GHU00275.1 fuculose phosphate aldolase [Betaproteobacteria bacterium]